MRSTTSLFEHLNFTALHLNAALNRALPNTITPSQFWVLRSLDQAGALSQQALCERLVQTKGNMTMVVNNLVKKKWVMRASNKLDRRAHMVMLTKAGKAKLNELLPAYEKTVAELLSPWNETECQTLMQLLDHYHG